MNQNIDYSNKSAQFDKLLRSMIPARHEKAEPETCVICHEPIGNFWDGCAQREYEESGRCQDCQDGE